MHSISPVIATLHPYRMNRLISPMSRSNPVAEIIGTLIGIAGRGWYQEEGKPAVEILPGTVIHIPANVKHWHGATAESWFAHLAFEIPGEDSSNEWLEPVTNKEYNRLPQ